MTPDLEWDMCSKQPVNRYFRGGLLLITWLFLSSSSLAQLVNEIPVDFDQVRSLLPLRNPGYNELGNSFTLQSGYKGFNSLSVNLKTFYADATLTFSDDTTRGHFIGFQTYVDQEGLFLRHNRFYGKYGYGIQLNSNHFMGLGASFGFINFSVLDNGAIGGFSSTRPDVKLGGYIRGLSSELHLSVLQFLDQRILFETGELKMKRYFQSFINKRFTLTQELSAETGLFFRYAPEYRSDLRAIIKAFILNHLYLGGSYLFRNSMIIEGGISHIPWNTLELNFGLSFRHWIASDVIRNANALELTLGVKRIKNN